MRLQRTLEFVGPISEGLESDEWNIGARSVREDIDEVFKEVFEGVEQTDEEKVMRVDIRIRRDDGTADGDPFEPNELGRHRVLNMRGTPIWDSLRDKWMFGGVYVVDEFLPELRRAISFYDGINATVVMTVQVAIAVSDGWNDLEEFESTPQVFDPPAVVTDNTEDLPKTRKPRSKKGK